MTFQPLFAAPSNEEFKIGTSQEFDSLNPLLAQMLISNYIYNLAGRSMLVLDADGKWTPQLAKAIPSLENGLAKLTTVNGKKTMVATWEIIEKANWGDGTPVTCADFQLSLDIANSSTVAVAEKTEYTIVAKIDWDQKTPKKCVFTYAEPRWDFYQIPRFLPLPAHIEGPIFKQYGTTKEGYEKNSNYSRNPSMPGLYNGPYRVAEIKYGAHQVFVANPYFYGPAPKIKKIVVKVIPNTAALEANLLSKDIDAIAPVGMTVDQAIAFDKKLRSEKLPYQVNFQESLDYEHLEIQTDNPMLKDKRVRQALMYGLNRKEMTLALFEGKVNTSDHYMSKIDPWFTNDPKKITVYAYDVKKANQLLDQAGWKMDTSTGYRTKDGQRLSLQIMTTAGNKIRETVQTYIQSEWKKIGVELSMKNEPARAFFGETIKKRKFNGFAMFARGGFPERIPSLYHSKSIPSEANGWSGRNSSAWTNKKVDKTIDQLEVEFNSKKRTKLAQEILKQFTDDVPNISLFNLVQNSITPAGLKNYRLTGHQFMETNNAENWEFVAAAGN